MSHPLFAAMNDIAFITVCRDIVADSPHVALDLSAIDRSLIAHVGTSQAISWDWYLSGDEAPLGDVFFQFAFNAALNGGYFEETREGVRQWEVKGSGSTALLLWIKDLYASRRMPGLHLSPAEVAKRFPGLLIGQPLAEQRLAIALEFADRERRRRFDALIEDTRLYAHASYRYTFPLHRVDELVEIYPAGFGKDPFRKKAILFFMMLAGYLETRDETVSYRLPLPSDYQIPRILAWKGIIKVAPEMEALLRQDKLIDVASAPVEHFRAAAIVAAREIGRLANRDDRMVDGALFETYRKDPDFIANALPPMRCASLWF